MRIAIVSTCAVPVPPPAYGGTELVVAELAKMLKRRGHDVTVYATGNSTPEATLRYRFETHVWPPNESMELRHAAFAWKDIAREDYDIVHTHQVPTLAFGPLRPDVPLVATLHHHRDPALIDFYLDFPETTHVAISRRQAELAPELGIMRVVHHGLDPARYPAGRGDGGYCAFVGRFAPEKGPHVAIDAALGAGVPIRLGGAPHWINEDYFRAEVAPRIARGGRDVEWLGEVSFEPKLSLMQGATALLFPLDWEEPFGLVMIEAMLVGTPVIAFPRGSVAEVVEDGVTGFIVRGPAEMSARLRDVAQFDRERCRARAVERWGAMRMAQQYERIYEELRRSPRVATANAALSMRKSA